jgi:hypothetical protein
VNKKRQVLNIILLVIYLLLFGASIAVVVGPPIADLLNADRSGEPWGALSLIMFAPGMLAALVMASLVTGLAPKGTPRLLCFLQVFDLGFILGFLISLYTPMGNLFPGDDMMMRFYAPGVALPVIVGIINLVWLRLKVARHVSGNHMDNLQSG